MNRQNRGIALISTFVFIALLFMMAVSMILTSRQRIFSGMSQHHQAEALYLAESGLARAQVALETDLDWPGVTDATIDGMNGTYTVTFGTGKYDSVKNIGIDVPAKSYRGDDTVPKNSALLVVVANVKGHRYVLESLVEGNGAVGGIEDAILASGRIEVKGDFKVDGIAALDDSAPVDGNMQSNLDDTPKSVTWKGGATDKAMITGTVGTNGSTMSSIDMPGATILGGPELNTLAPIPSYDVTAEVSANSGHPPPPIDAFGTSTLKGGKFSLGGTTINGDIILEDDATLYVSGDITINGSIRGNGTVWVDGKTTFKGDSEVTTNPDLTVSLFSKGNVKLTGFDGTQFLADNGKTKDLLQEASDILKYAQEGVKGEGNVLNTTSKDFVDDAGIALGIHPNHSGDININHVQPDGTIVTVGHSEVLRKLKDEINDIPSGETQKFLQERVQNLEDLFGSVTHFYPTEDDPEGLVIADFDTNGTTKALLDTATSQAAYWPAAVNLLHAVDYDKIGTSNFQGAIYTKGSFYADNEVNILGALIVDGNGDDDNAVTLPDGTKLNSGDIYLGNRSRVTFVKEMFDDIDSGPTGPQNLRKNLWMGR
jgi:hypothetical protein